MPSRWYPAATVVPSLWRRRRRYQRRCGKGADGSANEFLPGDYSRREDFLNDPHGRFQRPLHPRVRQRGVLAGKEQAALRLDQMAIQSLVLSGREPAGTRPGYKDSYPN